MQEHKHHEEIGKIEKMVNDTAKIVSLPNGLKFITEDYQDAPGLFRGSFWFNFGSKDESPVDSGIAHFLEHMAFSGTRKYYTRDIINREMRKFGTRLNASTNTYGMNFPFKNLDEDFEQVLDLVTQITLDQVFTEEALERERSNILNERARCYMNPHEAVGEWSWNQYVKDFALGHATIGTEDTIRTVNLESLLRYRDGFMIPNNGYFTLIGKLDEHKIEFARKLLSNFPSGNRPITVIPERQDIIKREVNVRSFPGINRAILIYYFKVPVVGEPDLETLALANGILCTISKARLTELLRETHGLTYGVRNGLNSNDYLGNLHISLDVDPAKVDLTMKLIDGELENLSEEGVSAEELEEARKTYRIGILGDVYASGKACDIVFSRDNMGLSNFDYYKRVFSVTPESLQKVVQRYLRPEKSMVNIALPEK